MSVKSMVVLDSAVWKLLSSLRPYLQAVLAPPPTSLFTTCVLAWLTNSEPRIRKIDGSSRSVNLTFSLLTVSLSLTLAVTLKP